MRKELLSLIEEYLVLFPAETERQSALIQCLNTHTDKEITDWNNFDGHIVASGFVYAKKEKKFLCLYHKDLKMYLYPGGHIDMEDQNVLESAKREVIEETGITNFQQFILSNNPFLPIDIDTHRIGYNERLHLPSHFHFDFRYLFLIEEIVEIELDSKEHKDYKWVDLEEFKNNQNFGSIVSKLEMFLKEE